MFLVSSKKIINTDNINKIYWYFGRYTTVEAELKDKSKELLFYIDLDSAFVEAGLAEGIIKKISELILQNKNINLESLENKDKGIYLCR